MGTKLANAPVYLTLAQVKFNHLLALEKYAVDIQESFRGLGYPDYRKAIVQTFDLNLAGPTEGQVVPVAPTAQYIFCNIEKTLGFNLQQDSITYFATDYDVFESFSDTLLQGLEIVHSAVGGLSYTDRVGVRYLDAVYPEPHEKLADYLQPPVLGLFDKIGGQLSHSFFETSNRVGPTGIVARVIVQPGKIAVPPDLQPLPLVIAKKFQEIDGIHATLDNDGAIESRSRYDASILRTNLFAIHDEIEKVFKMTVTPYALQKWK